jgi:hypothetical protein
MIRDEQKCLKGTVSNSMLVKGHSASVVTSLRCLETRLHLVERP